MTEAGQAKSILRVAGLSGLVGLVQLVTGLVRMKMFALLLGPSLLGYLGILNNYIQIVGSTATLGSGSVAIKQISELKDSSIEKHIAARRFASFGIRLSGLTALVSLAAAPFLLPLLSIAAKDFVQVSAGAAALVLSTVIVGVFFGLFLIREYVISTSLGTIVGTICAVMAIYFGGPAGVVWAVILVPVVTVAFQVLAVRRQGLMFLRQSPSQPEARISGAEFLRIARLGAPITILLLLQTGTVLVIRQVVLSYSGDVENGLLHAALSFSGIIYALFISATDGDFLRRLTRSMGAKDDSAAVMQSQIELVVPLLFVVTASGVVFADIAAVIFLSHEFLPAVTAIQIMIISEFFRCTSCVYGRAPLAFSRNWSALIPELSAALTLIAGAFLLIGSWGIAGAATAFLISRIVLLITSYVLSGILMGIKRPLRQILFMVIASVGLLAVFVVSRFDLKLGYALGICCMCYGGYLIARLAILK